MSTIKNNDLVARMDELCDVGPSVVISDIAKFENYHANRVLKEYGRFVKQFEVFYELTVELVKCINYIEKKDWPDYRGTQYILITHNLKSLYSSFDRLIKGFYEDSMILARPVYEAFIKLIYISCNQNDPYFAIAERKENSKEKFNFTNFVKLDLKLGWNQFALFSSMTHANQYSVLNEAVGIKLNGQNKPITLRFEFDKKFMELGINNITFLSLAYLKSVTTLFARKSNNILKKEFLEKASELICLRESDFLSHPKDYWPSVINDLRDIFKLLNYTETNSDWKIKWAEIRKNKEMAL